MHKKNLRSVAAALAPAAEKLPTQNVQPVRHSKDPNTQPDEPVVQFSFGLRKSLRKELQRVSADADMTMRGFILEALRDRGLSVTDEDLKDQRR